MNEARQTENVNSEKVAVSKDRPVFVPSTDVFEKEDAIMIRCDMPGVDEKELDITLEDHVLTIRGRQADDQPSGYDQLLSEYQTGDYLRSFSIKYEIDEGNIKARIRNGVLEVQLPKAKRAQAKRINVEA